jgi:hypothetical protein
MELSQFERRVLEFMAANDPEGEVLRAQLASATVLERDYTGRGVFVKIHVPESAPLTAMTNRYIQTTPTAYIRHPQLTPGAEAMLWFAEGRMEMLEFVTNGEEAWPRDEEHLEVEQSGANWMWKRDA